MRNLLAILASVSILVCAGCASNGDGSAKSPWSAGSSVSKAKAKPAASYTQAPEVAEAPAAVPAEEVAVAAPAVTASENGPLLAAYPALRQANKERALAAIEATKADSEPLPTPEEGKARVVAYNVDCSLIQFDSASAFKVGEKVVLSKRGDHALVQIVSAEEGGRYVAEEMDGVVGAPTLVPGDEIDCTVWIDPEDVAAVAAAAEKAKPQDSGDALEAVEEEEYAEEEEEYAEEEEVFEE